MADNQKPAAQEEDDDIVILSDEEVAGDVYEVENIVDVQTGKHDSLEFLVEWVGFTTKTWEPESNLSRGGVGKILRAYKEKNVEKINRILEEQAARKEKKRMSREVRSRSREERSNAGAAASSSSSADTSLVEGEFAPRELTEEDNFYGKPVKDLQGETRRLFDPSHMQTTTDLLLATYGDSDGRISRSKAAKLKQEISGTGSGGDSRSHTPSTLSPVAVKRTSAGRGRGSRGRGRGRSVGGSEPMASSAENVTVDDIDEGEDEVDGGKEKPTRGKAKTRTPRKTAGRGRGGGRGRGRGRKLAVNDVFDDEKSDSDSSSYKRVSPDLLPDSGDEKMDTSTPSPKISRKRAAKEPSPMDLSDERRSETPEVTKPKYFIGRDDDEDDDSMWASRIEASSSNPVTEISKLFSTIQCSREISNNESIINVILSGDIIAARLMFNRMSSSEIDTVVSRWRGPDGRPILHVLIHKMKPGAPGKASNEMAMMRLVLSFTRQFIFFIADSYGNMAIHEAVKSRNFRIVRLLANSSSLLVTRNNNGETPLMLAMSTKNAKIFQFLLNRGVTYHQLLERENSKEKAMLKDLPVFVEIVNKTSQQQNKELTRMRKRLMRSNIKDLGASSLTLIAPRHESNELQFTFECTAKLDHANQGHLLMMFPIVYHNTTKKWVASLNNIPIEKDNPVLNGLNVMKAQNKQHASVFLCVPQIGMNKLSIPLLNDSWNSCAAVAVQIVKYEKSNGQAPSTAVPPPLPPHSSHHQHHQHHHHNQPHHQQQQQHHHHHQQQQQQQRPRPQNFKHSAGPAPSSSSGFNPSSSSGGFDPRSISKPPQQRRY